MNAFKPGDLVLIIGTAHDSRCAEDIGKVSTVKQRCSCLLAMMCESVANRSYYQLNGLPNSCYREDALKKIDGDRPRVETETEETRDAPVAA